MKNSSSVEENEESHDLSHTKNSSNEENEESQDPSHTKNSSNEENEESQGPSHTKNSSNEENEESQDPSHTKNSSNEENEESQDPSHTTNSSNAESEESQDLSHTTNSSNEENEESQEPSHTTNSSNEESEESQDLSHTTNSSNEENEEYQDLSHTTNPPKKAKTSSPSPPRVQGKSGRITVPFPWATNRRAMVRNVYYLHDNKITTIRGRLQCKNCKLEFDKDPDLDIKRDEVFQFMEKEAVYYLGTAPAAWMNPVLERCESCGSEESLEPCLEGVKKRNFNWLFLYLSQLLGCCDSHQLKYFLKHNNINIAPNEDKGSLLYHVYMRLHKQLVPHDS